MVSIVSTPKSKFNYFLVGDKLKKIVKNKEQDLMLLISAAISCVFIAVFR